MKQSHAMSLLEAIANVVIGYTVAVGTQMLVFPMFGLHMSLGQNLKLGAAFTVLCRAQHKTVYAERTVMRSPWRRRLAPQVFLAHSLRIIPGVTDLAEHGHQLVRDGEATALQGWWAHGGKRLELFGRVGAQIHLGGLHAGMAEPEGDLADIAGGLQRVHGTAVAQDMRRHPLCCDRGLGLCRGSGMLSQNVFEPRSCHHSTGSVQEQLRVTLRRAHRDPASERSCRLLRATMEDHLKTGDLETLLEPYVKDLPPFYIYYPERNKRVECLRLLVEFLRAQSK